MVIYLHFDGQYFFFPINIELLNEIWNYYSQFLNVLTNILKQIHESQIIFIYRQVVAFNQGFRNKIENSNIHICLYKVSIFNLISKYFSKCCFRKLYEVELFNADPIKCIRINTKYLFL